MFRHFGTFRGCRAFGGIRTASAAYANTLRADAKRAHEPMGTWNAADFGAALEKLDGARDRDRVFKLFGRERLVVARSHHKVLRRELARAEQLHAALASGEPFPFAELLGERDGEGSGQGPADE